MESIVDPNVKTAQRALVNDAYDKLAQTIFAALMNIAVDGADPEEMLNVTIIRVENAHHFYSQVSMYKVGCLERYNKQAKKIYEDNLKLYVKQVIRRPLGRLLVRVL